MKIAPVLQPKLVPGLGSVQLAVASDKKAAVDAAKAEHKAKADALTSARQAYAEAEVKHATMVHAKDVDPEKLSSSREHLDECHANLSSAKKAAVAAEAAVYATEGAEFPKGKNKEEEEAEAAAAAAAEAQAQADAAAATAAAEAAAQAAGGSAAAAEAPAPVAPTAAAAPVPAAPAAGEAAADTVESLRAQLATANDKLKVLESKPAAEPAPAAAAPAAPARGPRSLTREAVATASVGFDRKTGKSVITIGTKAPTGEGVSTASAAEGKLSLAGLFNR